MNILFSEEINLNGPDFRNIIITVNLTVRAKNVII